MPPPPPPGAYIQLNLAENTSGKEIQMQQAWDLNVVHTSSSFFVYDVLVPYAGTDSGQFVPFMKTGQTNICKYM